MDLYADHISQTVGLIIATVFLTGMATEFILVRLLKKNYFSSGFLIINLCISFLQQFADVISKVIFIGAFIFVQQHYSIQKIFNLAEIKVANPFHPFSFLILLRYLFVIILADFCQYWLHRFSHEVNILWAGHVTHHSNNEYNYGVAVRQNALENFYTWVFFIPLALVGIPWQMFVTGYAVSLIWQFLVHTRLVNKLGVLEKFMATPSHHRVHHGTNPRYIDKNYGAFLIIWDKLFGTFEPETEPVKYGITEPLENQNPIWSSLHHHVSIIKSIGAEKKWSKKFRWIFGKPSSIYKSHSAALSAKFSEQKFTLQTEKKVYVFVSFLTVVIAAFLSIDQYEKQGNHLLYFFALAYVLCSFSIFAGLLECRPWADAAEIIRLVSISIVGIFLLCFSSFLNVGIAFVCIPICQLLFTGLIAHRYQVSSL